MNISYVSPRKPGGYGRQVLVITRDRRRSRSAAKRMALAGIPHHHIALVLRITRERLQEIINPRPWWLGK